MEFSQVTIIGIKDSLGSVGMSIVDRVWIRPASPALVLPTIFGATVEVRGDNGSFAILI